MTDSGQTDYARNADYSQIVQVMESMEVSRGWNRSVSIEIRLSDSLPTEAARALANDVGASLGVENQILIQRSAEEAKGIIEELVSGLVDQQRRAPPSVPGL
jgi:hypothetical protein